MGWKLEKQMNVHAGVEMPIIFSFCSVILRKRKQGGW